VLRVASLYKYETSFFLYHCVLKEKVSHHETSKSLFKPVHNHVNGI
jgi:acetone carboxylase gamma subunit